MRRYLMSYFFNSAGRALRVRMEVPVRSLLVLSTLTAAVQCVMRQTARRSTVKNLLTPW